LVKNVSEKNCCTTLLSNGTIVIGSTKCKNGREKCRVTKRRKCTWTASKGKHHCKKLRCCFELIKNGKVIRSKCRNLKKNKCKTHTKRTCQHKKSKNGCKYLNCCKRKTRNGKLLYNRCQNIKGSCPRQIKRRCAVSKQGNCNIRSCCAYKFNFRKGIWNKLKRSCHTKKKCKNTVSSCRKIKLINNCYKTRCLTLRYKNKKIVSKKCTKGKKVCLPQKITRCVRRSVLGTKTHFDHCCTTIYFNGRTKSRTCVSKNRFSPTIVKRSCKKLNLKNGCHKVRCCQISRREGKIVGKSCYNKHTF